MAWFMRRWRLWRLRRHRARLAAFDAGGHFSGDMRRWCLGRIAWHESLLTATPAKSAGLPMARLCSTAPRASEIKKPPPRPVTK